MKVRAPVERLLYQHSIPVTATPWLFAFHGTGVMFHGAALRHPDITEDKFVKVRWITLAFLPIMPMGIYLLANELKANGGKKWLSLIVHREVRLEVVKMIWGWRGVVWLFLSAWAYLLAAFALLVVLVVIADLLGWMRVSG